MFEEATAIDADSAVGDGFTRSVGADTTFRMILALVLIEVGMRLVERGANVASPAHPARVAYGTAVKAWRDRTRGMSWRGFVPTGGLVTITQTLWIVFFLLAVNVTLFMFGLAYVPMDGLLSHHVPHVAVRLSGPR